MFVDSRGTRGRVFKKDIKSTICIFDSVPWHLPDYLDRGAVNMTGTFAIRFISGQCFAELEQSLVVNSFRSFFEKPVEILLGPFKILHFHLNEGALESCSG